MTLHADISTVENSAQARSPP